MAFTMDAFALKERTALILGGSGGIGREIALGYKAAGAKVLIAARSQDKIDATLAELGQDLSAPAGYSADLRDVASLKALAAEVDADHGPLDILINCQGTLSLGPALEVTEEAYDTMLDTNLKSVFFANTVFGAGMVARGRGAIINIASLSAHTGWANAATYSASKWGVVSFTQTLAAEWGESGVRVNAITPGFFLTELNRDRMSPERKAEAAKRASMKRLGELQELVGAAIFLASDAAKFVSGATLRVDGGYLSTGI
ncbi:SDR family oxidoreductase [Acuticoccus sp. M5D2P5]|uniref:SDR family NAD(P)-dependent oxidoreductase n=1 Tax=Acuticoccus kalidii TaxID=2910977 RepID=UPI001F1FBD93|nr:SDR family oxidoreductase [Acuticoccus kalidii]MCF3936368.1 SDR family oxidoreductase [Acuticoccus kalidii]